MARAKKTAVVTTTTPSTAPKTRGIDLQEVEARVTALDKAKRRSYDIFDIEQRVYNLEKNGGGGGTGVKIETGTFTAGASNTPVEVTLSDITGKPDLIICKCLYLGEYLNEFVFIRPMHEDTATAGNYWHNVNEGNVYISDMTANNNGVKSVALGKFSFNNDGTFTGATITFTAYCWTEE